MKKIQKILKIQILKKKNNKKDKINENLVGIDVSPVKLQSVSSHSKKFYANRKLKLAESQMQNKLSLVLKLMNEAESDTEKRKKNEEIKKKMWYQLACWAHENKVEEQFIREKIQVLTIVPQSWSRRVVSKFNVTEYMVWKAQDLILKNGIQTIPGPRKANTISQEVMKNDEIFYKDDAKN